MNRRFSLVGPLLLIGIGALLLLFNLRREWINLDAVAQVWPYALIGWGLLRATEILIWRQRNIALPEAGISGGEWTLVLFVTLVGLGVLQVRDFTAGRRWPMGPGTILTLPGIGQSFDYPMNADVPAGASPRIRIENLRGNVRVVGSDTQNVTVTGRLIVKALDQSAADRIAKATRLDLESGAVTVVRTNLHLAPQQDQVSAELEINVPRGATVECGGRRGDFDVSNVTGLVSVTSDNAGVRVDNVGGLRVDLRRSDEVRARNVQGDVDIRGRGEDLDLEAVQGRVTVQADYSGTLRFARLPEGFTMRSSRTELRVAKLPGEVRLEDGNLHGEMLAGPIMLTSRSKDVRLRSFAGPVNIRLDERGDVELYPGQGTLAPIDVRTDSGNVTLGVPTQATAFELQATSERGDPENEFGPPLSRTEVEKGGRIEGRVGTNGPRLVLFTRRGDVRVERDSGTEAAVLERLPDPPPAPVPPSRPSARRP